MKKITLLLLLSYMVGIAQIKGNKSIETRTFPAENLTDVEISLYAKLTIDQSKEEGITITADNNLFDFIDFEVVDGTLKLNQKEWIQSSERMTITIGAPKLKRVQQGTNDTAKIINLDNDTFQASALNGKIVVFGRTNSLRINAENGTVDASETNTKEAFVNIWGDGKAIVNATELVTSKLDKNAKLELVSTPKEVKGDIEVNITNNEISREVQPRYIDFKIRNNSINRNNFYVIGPKPNGGHFSYGFPIMPFKTKKEKWTTGTKIFKVNSWGIRKLLTTITVENENKSIDLF